MGEWPGSRRLRKLESSEMNMTEIQLEDISVMRVVAKGGPSGARAAFDEVESKLPSLRGRKFYGTYHEGEYRASVAMNEGDTPHALQLTTKTTPKTRKATPTATLP